MTEQAIFDWTIEESTYERLDKFLTEELPDYSRSQIQQWIKDGQVTVNGQQVRPNYKLHQEDVIRLVIPQPEEYKVEPEAIALDIYYEDEDVIVINKPRGMVVHPAPGHYKGTLVNALLAHCQDLSGINGVLRPGIVHRIDKDTSGLIMVAKNDQAHIKLSEQLQAHTVTRQYLAIVQGRIPHNEGTIDAPIGRDPKNRQQMTIIKTGKKAITHFKVLELFKEHTYVSCSLETGRTHQIRVHMNYIGHPLLGDPKYSGKNRWPIEGQALHAHTLGFKHPRTGEELQFEAPIPTDMSHILHMLKNQG